MLLGRHLSSSRFISAENVWGCLPENVCIIGLLSPPLPLPFGKDLTCLTEWMACFFFPSPLSLSRARPHPRARERRGRGGKPFRVRSVPRGEYISFHPSSQPTHLLLLSRLLFDAPLCQLPPSGRRREEVNSPLSQKTLKESREAPLLCKVLPLSFPRVDPTARWHHSSSLARQVDRPTDRACVLVIHLSHPFHAVRHAFASLSLSLRARACSSSTRTLYCFP